MYIHIYIFDCIRIHICICVCNCISFHICMCIHISICICFVSLGFVFSHNSWPLIWYLPHAWHYPTAGDFMFTCVTKFFLNFPLDLYLYWCLGLIFDIFGQPFWDLFFPGVVRWHCPDWTGTRILRHLASLRSWQGNLPTLVLFQNPVWSPVKSTRWSPKVNTFFFTIQTNTFSNWGNELIRFENSFWSSVKSVRWGEKEEMSRKCHKNILYRYQIYNKNIQIYYNLSS